LIFAGREVIWRSKRMSGLRKLERDFMRADLAAVSSLLAQLNDEDVMARFGLEARRDELQQAIARIEEEPEEPTASAALFFGGRPVVGTHGIESEFAGVAVSKFQDIVSKVMAHEAGTLGQRGVVPNKAASKLHITNVVRGSFGFLLEEVQVDKPLAGTALKGAVEETTRLLDAFGRDDEESYRTVVESIDERVLTTAREFFDLMRDRGATLRLVSGDTDRSFGADAVVRAVERATTTKVEDREETIEGQLAGFLPSAHEFEFRAVGERGTINGKVDRTLTTDKLEQFNRELVGIRSEARIHIRRLLRSGALVRESFMLLSLRPTSTAL
jgi:hypothetical protein